MPSIWKPTLSLVILLGAATGVHAQNCDQRRDPHSFACSDDAFRGIAFPMIDMSEGRIQGRWALVTYADLSGRPGPEFRMLVDPQNPRVPRGVINQRDGSRAGGLTWVRGRGSFANFGAGGRSLFEEAARTAITDRFTAQMILSDGREVHALQCRIFNRRNIEHLQCRWQTLSREQNRFILRGYLGFLRAR